MRDGTSHGGYRPEIDGLRAVAVVPVVFFHAGSQLFSGGYVGVDVFFVISGYLITTIIRGEIAAGSFSLAGFYERRARRILPALVLVTLACLPFAWAWMLPSELQAFGRSLEAVNLFASNVLFWSEEGYFGAASELKPLLHTWSLAVEEQFYVLFPLLLLALFPLGARALLGVLAAIVLVSLGLAHWGAGAAPSATFYLLPMRAWELGAGALLAVAAPAWRGVSGWRAEAGAAAGLAAIAASVLLFGATTPFPSLWALAPVAGAAAVIAFARPQTLVGRVLGWRPVVAIGLVSYSFYLWHQPIFAFARIRAFGEPLSAAWKLALIALALVLAFLTWRIVEQPFRRRTTLSRGQVFAAAGAGAATLIGVGALADFGRGLPWRVSPEVLAFAAWQNDYSPHREACHGGPERPLSPADACVLGVSPALSGAAAAPLSVWGDSHAVELAWRLSERLGHSAPVRQLTHTDCAPIVSDIVIPNNDPTCGAFNAAALDALEREQAGPPVILLARWSILFEAERFDNSEGGVESGGERALPHDDPAVVGEQLRKTVEALLAADRPVVLVYPVPEVGWNVPVHLLRSMQLGVARTAPLSTSREVFRARNRHALEQLDRIGEHPGLIRVRPEELLCGDAPGGRCVAEMDGEPLYYDDDHLNSRGADLLVDAIFDALAERGWLDGADGTLAQRQIDGAGSAAP